MAGVLLSGEGGGVKRPEREPDHQPRASAEAENDWTYIFIPPYDFMTFTWIYLPSYTEHNLKTHTFQKKRCSVDVSGLQCVLSERWDAGCLRCRIVALDNYSSFHLSQRTQN